MSLTSCSMHLQFPCVHKLQIKVKAKIFCNSSKGWNLNNQWCMIDVKSVVIIDLLRINLGANIFSHLHLRYTIGLCGFSKNVIHLFIPSPLWSLGDGAKGTLLSVILVTHLIPFWFSLLPCMKIFTKEFLLNFIVYCQSICLLHISQYKWKYFSVYKSKKRYIAPTFQAWPSICSLISLFFFVGSHSNNKTTTWGCG
jgi:hypothetical protein